MSNMARKILRNSNGKITKAKIRKTEKYKKVYAEVQKLMEEKQKETKVLEVKE
jgi:hypothetical protein